MKEFSGTIMKIENEKAIVMTDNCDFVEINKRNDMEVGQEIRVSSGIKARNIIKYSSLVASIFIIIFSFALYHQLSTPNHVFAYVDVDINPSLEIAIDKNAKVMNVKPLNKDAETILMDLKLKNLPVKQAVAEVVKESKYQGFIKSDKKNTVLISASIDADRNYKTNGPEEKILDNILTEIGSTTINLGNEKIKSEVMRVTPEYRNLAVKYGISMGRYALYNRMRQKGINVSIEEAKTAHISEMLNKSQMNNFNDIKAGTENNDAVQVNQIEKNQNQDSTSSQNGKDEVNKVHNDDLNNYNTFEEKKDVDDVENQGTKDNNISNSNEGNEEEKRGSTGQNATVGPNNNSEDSNDTSSTENKNGRTDESAIKGLNTEVDGNSDMDTSEDNNTNNNNNTDENTTVDSNNQQDNANSDEHTNTPIDNQIPNSQNNINNRN